MELRSMYALRVEDNPTEEQIAESVKKQMEQLVLIEGINKRRMKKDQPIIDTQEYLNKTTEDLKTEYDLLNNQ